MFKLRFWSFVLLALVIFACHKETVAPYPTVTPNDFLSETKYNQLTVEIQYVAGSEPSTEALDNLKSFLQQRINKSAGITFVQRAIADPGKSIYSLDDIEKIETANRTLRPSGKTLTVYLFFANGDSDYDKGTSKVLGFTYSTTSMVLFEKTIESYANGVGRPSVALLESTVLSHESGHLLGLVNNGTAMVTPHQDTANGNHCDNKDCLMYYQTETSEIISNMGGSIPQLDANCLADLAANGGK